MTLKAFLGDVFMGVLACYQSGAIVHHMGMVYPKRNNQLRVFIPGGHKLGAGAVVTVHLDNRTGVDMLDADLKVYRCSYKGRITQVDEHWALIDPVEFMLVHGFKVVEQWREPGYEFPADERPARALIPSPRQVLGPVEFADHDNKAGVLTTLSKRQPHTTVLAFLSAVDKDVFIISQPDTFKLALLKREPRCYFTIDERASYVVGQAGGWRWRTLEMMAYQLPAGSAMYEQVREAFVQKIPFEAGFFSIPGLEVIHLQYLDHVPAGVRRRV